MSFQKDMNDFESSEGDYTKSLGTIPDILSCEHQDEQAYAEALGRMFKHHYTKDLPPMPFKRQSDFSA